jgi:MoaA/NifB/PqqE/SkfB family radical SAM enzyme
MIQTTAVNLTNNDQMMVTWDVGKRCNYDCTYCDAGRHDNFSPHASYEELLKTFKFVQDWTTLYNSKRLNYQYTDINFTGGEPTNNPNFWKLVEYIKINNPEFHLGLTTNGTWGKRKLQTILDTFVGVTVSFHFEADKTLRDLVLSNIIELSKHDIWLQVNVMLHMDLWDDVMEVCDVLDIHKIKYNPVPIGDGPETPTTWFKDTNGIMRRSTHTYSAEQQSWYFKKMNTTAEVVAERKGTNVGRTCCGGRCLTAKVDNEWQEVKLINTEFKNWNCTVDWYFLHIDQTLGQVFHHQTCQATHTGRGPIGYLTETDNMLSKLRLMLEKPVAPIVCPNQRCGCGMCVPKARDIGDFKVMWAQLTSVPIQETQI